jgi:ankyrin repeat protein
VPED